MPTNPNLSTAQLRHRAEAQLRKRKQQQRADAAKAQSTPLVLETDSQRQFHELQVHQVELEMQNIELQKVREELEATLEQYTDLYDFAPVGYFTLAPDSTVQQVNLAGASLVGIERSRLVGRCFDQLFAAGMRATFRAFLQQVFANQAKQSGDFDLLHPGQSLRTVNIKAQCSLVGDSCRVAVMDITERKLAEDKVRESEERFRVMANAMSQMAWIARPDGHLYWYNQRWYDYTGTTPKQMEGWGWQSVHDPAVLPSVLKRWRQSLATGADFEMTFPLRRADGCFHPFLTRGIPVKDADGRVVQWLGTNTDVTEQQRAEDKVRVSEVRYRRLFEAAHDGVLLLDPFTRKITDANPFMTKLLGYSHAQLVGKELFEIGLHKDESASRIMFQKLKRDHEVRYEDLPLKSKTGQHQDAEVVANLYQENGHSVIQCNVRDITARKLTQAALRESEERLRLAIAGSDLGTWHWDIRTGALDWSERCRNIFGIPPRTVMSYKKFLGALHPEDRARADDAVQRAIRDDSEYRIEFRSVWPDGSVHWAVALGHAYYDAAGKPTRMEGIALDITERKRAERALRESERQYGALATASSEVAYRMSADWSTLLPLDGRQLVASSDRPLTDWTWLDQNVPPDEHPCVRQAISEAIARKSLFELEHRIRRPDGSIGWTLSRAVPILDENGAVIAWFGAASDITERKQAEEALRASKERFRAAVGLVTSLIWTNNAKGMMQGEQPGWSRFTGQTLKECQGYGWFKAIHPEDVQPTIAAWEKAVAGEKLFEFEHRVRRRDGAWRLCSVHAAPSLGPDGVICEWVGVHTDITERKQAEAAERRIAVLAISNLKLEQEIVQRLEREKSLKQSDLLKSQMLEQSHLMQNQLRHLSRQVLHAQEEERKRISRDLHDVIAQTLTGINTRLAALKNEASLDHKGFDRSITRTQKLVEHSVDIVHEFARELRPAMLDDLGLIPALHSFVKIFSNRTQLHVDLKAFAGVEQLDSNKRTMLYRVAQEALNNVARHAKASRVKVSIQKRAGGISLKISDDGKSFNVARALPANGGKRLGLVSMRERVEMVGGNFAVESAPGKGTTIIAQIPARKHVRDFLKRGGRRRALK